MAELEGVDEKDVDVSLTADNKFEVEVGGTRIYTLAEDAGGVTRLPGVPTPAEAFEVSFPDGVPTGNTINDIVERSAAALITSGFVSDDAVFTPKGKTDGKQVMEISNIDWNSNLNSKVPFFYYDRDEEGSTNNYSIRDAYLVDNGPAETDGKLSGGGLDDKDITHFAIIPFVKANGSGIRYNIIFKSTTTGKIYFQNGTEITSGGFDGSDIAPYGCVMIFKP